MSSGKTNQTLRLSDGRQLGFAAYGSSAGFPVFHFHGSASSRLEHPASEEMLVDLDIRFISVDRPGHGLSDFQPGRRLLDWPEDIRQLATHLGYDQFFVEGYSAGGPHALACAQRLPEQVMAGALIGSAAPTNRPGAYDGLPLSNQLLARSARWFPRLTYLVRRLMRRMVMGDAEKTARQLMASIPESDKAILFKSQIMEVFINSVREGFRPGSRGVAYDDILINRAWGFDLTQIRPRIDIWQGEADVNVPAHAARYLDQNLPHSRTTFLPGAGHFFIFDRWEEVLSRLVSVT